MLLKHLAYILVTLKNESFFQNVGDKADEFGHMNGKYQVTLIIGDAVIQNPIVWTLVSLVFYFDHFNANNNFKAH